MLLFPSLLTAFQNVSHCAFVACAECTHWHTAEVKKRLTHCIGNNLSVRLAVGPGVSLNGSYTGGMSVSMSNNYV